MKQRIDLHIHTFHSDGVMLPGEVVNKAIQDNYKALAFADHADESNLEELIYNFKSFLKMSSAEELEIIIGVELTFVMPEDLESTAHKARELGAALILVHGDSPAESYNMEINQAAVEAPKGIIDIIAHPGFITIEQAKMAAQKDIYLELTARKGHCLTNGHIANVARTTGAKLIVNSDAHAASDLVSYEFSRIIARGAGLNEEEVDLVTDVYPEKLLERARISTQ